VTRAEREAKKLPSDHVPTRDEMLALLERLHNTQSALARCRARNARLRAKQHPTPNPMPTTDTPPRRRLTLDEAQRGVQPDPMTRDEWDAMHEASGEETVAKIHRIVAAMLGEVLDGRTHGP
jgi:hypothetical protein